MRERGGPTCAHAQYVYERTPPRGRGPAAGCWRSGSRWGLLPRQAAHGGSGGGAAGAAGTGTVVTDEWREVLNEAPDLGFDVVSEVGGGITGSAG